MTVPKQNVSASHLQHVFGDGGLHGPVLDRHRKVLQSPLLLPLGDPNIVVGWPLGVRHQQQFGLLLVSDARPLAGNNNSIVRKHKKWPLEDLSIMECDKSNKLATHGHHLI